MLSRGWHNPSAIQLPEETFARTKRVCEARETSLAELACRGIEFRKLYDVRSALPMPAQGVSEFATVNVKDFEGVGIRKVRNPLAK